MGYYFLLPDWTGEPPFNKGGMWGVALGYAAYVILISSFLIFTKLVSYNSLNFNIPLGLIFAVLFISYGLPTWSRAVLIISMVFLAFPVNMLTTVLKTRAKRKYSKEQQYKK